MSWAHFVIIMKIAEIAAKKGIIVISDEVYRHVVFGNEEFMAMGMLGSVVPVLSIGSMSKRWLIPGWRLGWIAASDPNGLLKKSGVRSLTFTIFIYALTCAWFLIMFLWIRLWSAFRNIWA